MRAHRTLAIVSFSALSLAVFFGARLSSAQQGPLNQGSETVARPKKPVSDTPAETEQPKIPSQFEKKDRDAAPPEVNFKSDVTTVSVDVAVLDNKGHFIPKIPKDNFRILEDGVPQQVSGYTIGEAPMTIAMVIEFSARFQSYYSRTWFQTLQATYGFVSTLKPEDYLAVVAYDMRPEILSDFSADRAVTNEALQRLRIPGFSESNLYDALIFTAKRMQDIEGRKAILLLSSGIDTFSKVTYSDARRALQDAGVPIYAIGLMQAVREMADAGGQIGAIDNLTFLQADNQMRTFAHESGGMAFFPRFEGEFPNIFRSISESMRNQYVLSYSPSNQARDGKVRKIKVELVNPANNQPLRVVDEKGKPIKYEIIAKSSYTAPREVE